MPEDVPRRVIEAADVVVAPLEVPIATAEEVFRLARMANVHTALNAAPAKAVTTALLELSDVVICNEVELATLLGRTVPAGAEAEGARLLRLSPDQVVVVTLGSRGAIALVGDDVLSQPTFAVNVVDTVGAGDAFVAGFLVGRWWQGGVASALRLGCAAGALATTVRGAQPSMPTLAALRGLARN
jgi:ribokinase